MFLGNWRQSLNSLSAIKKDGANWVQLVPTWYQQSKNANSISADPNWTASNSCLATAITQAHSQGLKVLLKPHVDSKDGTWRGYFVPSDADAWFASYKAMMVSYAQLAAANNVEMLSIGTELVNLSGSTYAANWQSVMSAIRKYYSGQLTYAADMSELSTVCFWTNKDISYVGIDAYYQLTSSMNPSLYELWVGWQSVLQTLWSAYSQTGKPILVTEIGYRSMDGSNMEPWSWQSSSVQDVDEQADCYKIALESISNAVTTGAHPWIKGMFWWAWSIQPLEADNQDYTPEGKLAEQVLRNWFGTKGSLDFNTNDIIQNTTKSYSFVVGPSSSSTSTWAAMKIAYQAYSQSMSNYRWNQVQVQVLKNGSVVNQYTDSYPSESSWGTIPGYLHQRALILYNVFPGDTLTIKVTVSPGDWMNYISQLQMISFWGN